MKRFFLLLFSAVILLAVVVLINTFRKKSVQKQYTAQPAPPLSPRAVEHFQQAIRHKTISFGDASLLDTGHFFGFHRFLQQAYPLIHKTLTREVVANYSLLYRWQGKNDQLKPIILMAHQDVVPVEEGTENMWAVDPYGGVVKEDTIWGRGTVDDKINLISMMESAEKLLQEGYTPERTIYFFFGHDEEMGGSGARAAAALLKSRGVVAELILDEGGIITNYQVPGMTKPVALLGTSEKGFLSLDFTVHKSGGHSSMPDKETAIDILTRAIVKLRAKPFDPDFSPSLRGFIDHLGPEMPFTQRMAFANLWLFRPMIVSIYEESGAGNAMLRTTIAPTILDAGVKDNVIPTIAKATINFRLLPGDSSEAVIARVKKIINDERIVIDKHRDFVSEPSAVTSTEGYAFSKVDEVIKRTLPGVISSPFLMIGGTDSRYFNEVSTGIIKFSPMADPIGFHGINERISLDSYRTAIWFYEQLMKSTN